MELKQTKKSINAAEIELISQFAVEAANNPELNWNKVMERINRDRAQTGVQSLRRRCFIAIMKAGGADDGRVKGWSKKKYMKTLDIKVDDVAKVEVPQQNVQSVVVENEIAHNEPESSPEAEAALSLSSDALALLNYFINHGVQIHGAKKFFGVGIKRLHAAMDEMINMQLIRADGPVHTKGVKYYLCLDKTDIKAIYPQINGVCLTSDMSSSRRGRKSKQIVIPPKSDFEPQSKLQDAVNLLRNNSEKGIPYKDCEEFKPILTNGNWSELHSIQKMLEELEILVRVGADGKQWFFQDPEENVSVHDDPKIDKKAVEPEVVKENGVQIVPEVSRLTEDVKSITVNCYREDIKYRVTKSSDGYVIDIM